MRSIRERLGLAPSGSFVPMLAPARVVNVSRDASPRAVLPESRWGLAPLTVTRTPPRRMLTDAQLARRYRDAERDEDTRPDAPRYIDTLTDAQVARLRVRKRKERR